MIERSGDDHFFVTLPSNSSRAVYGKQSPAHYRTKLTTDVVLNPPEWEVGLCEISYPRTWSNVVGASFVLKIPRTSESWEPTDRKGVHCKIPTTRYKSPEHLIHVMSEHIQ